MHPRRLARAAVLAVALAAAAAPAALAADARTDRRGWRAVGPVQVGRPVAFGAAGAVVAVLGDPLGDGTRALWVRRDDDERLGRAPGGGLPARGALGVTADGALLVADDCRVRRSADGGASWRIVATLPPCPRRATSGLAPVELAVRGQEAWALGGDGVARRSSDGGRTWVDASDPIWALATAIPTGPGRAMRLTPGHVAPTLARTTDGGRTWQWVAGTVPGGGFADVLSASDPHPIGVRGPGASVIGNGARLAITDGDAGVPSDPTVATMRQLDVPTPPELAGAERTVVDALACDPDGAACAVGVTGGTVGGPLPDAPRTGVLLRGDVFGERVAPPPIDAVAPRAGAIVGWRATPWTAGGRVSLVASDDRGATPYGTLLGGDERRGSIADGGLLALPVDRELWLSGDAGRRWRTLPMPSGTSLQRVAGDVDAPVALGEDGVVRQYGAAGWVPLADASSLRPTALAAVDGGLLVAGPGGVARIEDGSIRPIGGGALAGRALDHLAGSGATALAWATSGGHAVRDAARSTDGGRTWRALRLPAGTDVVQLASPTVVHALAGRALHRSTDGGARFRRLATLPRLATGAGRGRLLALDASGTGVAVAADRAFLLAGGGRSPRPLPTPRGVVPTAIARRGVAVALQDPRTGSLLRHARLAAVGGPRLRIVRTRRRGSRVVVDGRLSGAPRGAVVTVATAVERAGGGVPLGRARVGRGGAFRVGVRASRAGRRVQAWYAGDVRAAGTARGAVSAVRRVG